MASGKAALTKQMHSVGRLQMKAWLLSSIALGVCLFVARDFNANTCSGIARRRFQSSRERAVQPRRAVLSESFLAYMHIPKTGGTSFNQMLLREPLSFSSSRTSLNAARNLINCGIARSFGEANQTRLDQAVRKCNHFTYEGHFQLFKDIKSMKANSLILTHVRSPFWHVLSMLGHDLRQGRYETYFEKISGKTQLGYRLDNPIHHRFQAQNTSMILSALEREFFWFGVSEHMEASLCLLLWQLNDFDHKFCLELCGRNEDDDDKNTTSSYARKNVSKGKAEHEILSQTQMKDITRRTAKDQVVYDFALFLFNERVNFVEKQVGFRFLNCHQSL